MTRLGASLALLTIVTGCMAGGGAGVVRLGPAGSQGSGVEGAWVDESGVGISNFSGGVFTTTAADNGNRLSEGTYRYDGNSVAITGTSLIRQTPIAFNCDIASANQLNCTSVEGNRFMLTRRS